MLSSAAAVHQYMRPFQVCLPSKPPLKTLLMAFQVGGARCVPDLPHSSGLLSSFKEMNEDMSWFNDTLHNEAMKTEKQHFSRERQNSLCIGEII